MSTGPALESNGLGKRFGSTWALRDCSLEIPRGRVTALVGPNGAGKTTLLHLAVGLSEPSAGTLRVLGASPLLVRANGHLYDARWTVSDVGLEEIVLAYLGRASSTRETPPLEVAS